MIQDLGTIRPGTTVYIPFHTFDSNDPSASVTLTGLATTDIEIYKDGGTTQRASDAGYALLDTDGIDIDGITGIHGISVNLADNTTAGFYAAGSQYWIVISSITVDTATINFILATFRIGYENAVINTTIATLASQTSFTLTSGPAEDDALNGMWCIIHDVASAVQLGKALILDYTGSTKTVTLAAGTTFTAAATDNISIMDIAPLQPTTTGRTLDVSSGGEAGLDWANVGSPTTTVGLSGTTVKTATDVETDTQDLQSRLPAALGANGNIKADVRDLLGTAWLTPTTAGTPDVNTKTITDGIITAAKIAADAITAAKLASDVATEIQSGLATQASVNTIDDFLDTEVAAILAAVDTEIGAIKTVVDAIEVDTQDIQGRLPAALIGGRMDSSVEAMAGGVITDAAFSANAIVDTAIDATVGVELSDAIGNNASIQTILSKITALVPADGTIGGTGNTTTTLHLAGLAYANDAINSMTLVIQDVSTGLHYARWIEDWADTGDLATVATLPFTPQASADLYWILPNRSDVTGGSGLDAAGVRAALGMASANLDTQLTTIDDFLDTEIAAIKAKTDSLTFSTANRVNAQVFGMENDVVTAAAIGDGAIDAGAIAAEAITASTFAVDAINANVLSDSAVNEIQSGLATATNLATIAGYIDTEVASILAAVDTEIAAIKAKTDNLPTDPADASDIAASFASIASTLSTLAAYVDTEVAAIKAKTDSLTFTVANVLDANIQRVNDVAVAGTGASGDEWGPA